MFLRHLGSLCLATGMLTAADTAPKLASPDLGKLTQNQFQQLLLRALEAQPPTMALELDQVSELQRECAIPLLKSKVDHAEKYRMPHAPVVGGLVDPIGTAPKTAACPQWNADK